MHVASGSYQRYTNQHSDGLIFELEACIMSQFTVLVCGNYGSGNFGDDVLAAVVYKLLRKRFQDNEFAFVADHNGYLNRWFPESRSVSRNTDGISSDLLLYGGGTQFFSFSLTRMRKGKLPERLFNCVKEPARVFNYLKRRFLQKVPIRYQQSAAIGIGVGPFVPGSLEELEAKKLFRNLAFIAVRDSASYALCKEWGLPSVIQGADLCYLPGLWVDVANASPLCQTNSQKIGIVVRDWPHSLDGAAYVEPLLELAKRLRQGGLEVRFILFQSTDSEWRSRLEDQREDFLLWNPERSVINEFMLNLGRFDCFITARYHGAVLGSVLGKPSVCIEVEPKLRFISEVLGESGALWAHPFDPEAGRATVLNILSSYERRVEILKTAVVKQSSLATAMGTEFLAFLGRTKCNGKIV